MDNDKSFYPKWTDEPPEQGTYRSIFKWGDPDKFKHPNQRLYEMVKEKFQMSDSDFNEKKSQGQEKVNIDKQVKLSGEHINIFTSFVGKENVSSDDYSRVKYGSGKTTEEAMSLRS